jgi:hypothetical protein
VNGEANRVMWPRVSTTSGVHREPREKQINRVVTFVLDHDTTNSLMFHVYWDKHRLNHEVASRPKNQHLCKYLKTD